MIPYTYYGFSYDNSINKEYTIICHFLHTIYKSLLTTINHFSNSPVHCLLYIKLSL